MATELIRDLKHRFEVGGRVYVAQVCSPAPQCEQTVFAQRKRVADAERSLAAKITKKAQEHVRIGTAKVEENLGWIADIKRAELKPRDARMSTVVSYSKPIDSPHHLKGRSSQLKTIQ